MTIMGYWQSLWEKDKKPSNKDLIEHWKEENERMRKNGQMIDGNPVIGKCPQCGIELRKLMLYACQRPMCPTGLGSTARMKVESPIKYEG